MPDTLQQTIAREVRGEMARQQKRQRELAAELGLSITQVGKRLNGVVDFRTSELERIASWLGVPVQRFVESAGTGR